MSKYIPVALKSQEAVDHQRARKRVNSARTRATNVNYQDREQRRLYLRHGQKWALDPNTTELCVVDGESDEHGHYNLYQVFAPSIGLRSLRAGKSGRLGLFQVARFLNRQRWAIKEATGKKAVFIAFSYGYDVNQQLFGETILTEDEKAALWHMRSRSWGAKRGPRFSPELPIPAANASVQIGRKTGYVTFHRDGKRDTTVRWQDFFTLFAKSFVSAVSDYAKFWTDEEHALMDDWLQAVKDGKAARGKWAEMGYSESQIADVYQEPELRLMHWLASKVVSLCKEVELYPKSLAGPAPIARALNKKYGLSSHIRPADYETVAFQEGQVFRQYIRGSFYGGRIESAVCGYLQGGYSVYDINSAFPHQITKLPCGAHGHFVPLVNLWCENTQQDLLPYAVYTITWKCKPGTRWGPFPVRRRNDSIHYPLQGRGSYHSAEIQAFLDTYADAEYNISDGIVWVSECEHDHPFAAMIEETYARRNEYKKAKNPAGNVLKLGMNSGYGILAQTAGSYRIVDEDGKTTGYSIPKSSNLFLAGMVTAGARAQILRMIAKNPENVFAIATDAIKCFDAMPELEAVESDDKVTDRPLGGLEHEIHTDAAILVAPGIIFHAESDDKYRGIPGNSTWWVGTRQFDTGFAAAASALTSGLDAMATKSDKYQNPFDIGCPPDRMAMFVETERVIELGPGAIRTKRDIGSVIQEIAPKLWYVPPYIGDWRVSKIYSRPMDHDSMIFEREDQLQT